MKKFSYAGISLFIIFLMFATISLKAQTIIQTWDFESALDNWAAGNEGSSIALSTDHAYTGSSSVKLVKPATGLEINVQNDVYENLQQGDVLTFHIWISAADLALVNGCQIFWQTTDSWNWNSQWTNGSSLTGDGWSTVEHTLPAIALPLQRIGFQLLLQTGNEAQTPSLYVDGITVTRVIVPVELVSFTANVIGNKITLSWKTATELNNAGFEIQRSNDNQNFVSVGYVRGKGTTTEIQNYSYEDNIINSGSFYYRLKQVDFNGSFEYSDVVEAATLPTDFSLSQNYPNPFNPSTTISFNLPEKRDIHLILTDVLGNVVEEIAGGNYEAGYHKVELNASHLVSGVYFYRLEAGNFLDTKKLILMK